MSNESSIISKVWSFAHVLRDDGVGYGDYLEQITYLLFLKMADELNKPPYNKYLPFPRLKDVEGNEIPDGIPSFYLDRLSKAFLKGEEENQNVMDYEEFELLVQNEESETMRLLSSGIELFEDFDIEKKPILWTLLLSSACIYYVLSELKHVTHPSLVEILKLTDKFYESWKDKYITESAFEAEYKPSVFSKVYIQKRIKEELGN